MRVSTIQLGATVSSAGPSSTVTQTRIYVTLPSAAVSWDWAWARED